MLGDDIDVRRHDLEPGRGAARVRLDRRAITRRPRCAWPTPRPAPCARCSRKPSGRTSSRAAGWRVLWATNEILWYSQRDDWSQLYLYDLDTGRLKNQITTGDGPVTRIVTASTRRRARCGSRPTAARTGRIRTSRTSTAVGLDGKSYVSLTPDDGKHAAQISPDGKYVIDTYPTPDVPPEVVLRDADRRGRHAAREGRHLEARRDAAGSRRCRSR